MCNTPISVSASDYRRHLRSHFDSVRKSGEPLLVTKDGEPEVVVLSPEAYTNLVALAESDRADKPPFARDA